MSAALSNAVAFFGLGVGLSHGSYGDWAPFMGLAEGFLAAASLGAPAFAVFMLILFWRRWKG